MQITNEQKKTIHTLVGVLGWSDQLYREFLERFCGVKSCTGLLTEQAADVIAELEAFKMECSPMITAKQISYIKYLWLSVDYDQGNCGDKHLSSFLEKRYGVNHPEELTKRQALGCISAIKRMQANREKQAGGTSVSAVITPDGEGTMWVQLPDGQRYACPIKKEVDHGKLN